MGISEQTFHRWKKLYAGLGVGEQHRLKLLEEEKLKLKQLVADRIPIRRDANERCGLLYTVRSLTAAERDNLALARFGNRSNNRLGSIYDKQRLETERLVRWVETTGRDPKALEFFDKRARLVDVPASIRTLMKNRYAAEDVGKALRSENARRLSMPAAAPIFTSPEKQPAAIVSTEHQAQEIAARRERLETLCPTVDAVVTPEVKDFVGALRTGIASSTQLDELADMMRAKLFA